MKRAAGRGAGPTRRKTLNRRAALLTAAAAVLAALLAGQWTGLDPSPEGAAPRPAPAASTDATAADAFARGISDVWIAGAGEVLRTLPDDREGSRHQRFILELSDGQTLLVAHNIDLAPRLENLRPGDRVEFSGEYEWNPRGGVLHWTHHDPGGRRYGGRRDGGWLKHEGRVYR